MNKIAHLTGYRLENKRKPVQRTSCVSVVDVCLHRHMIRFSNKKSSIETKKERHTLSPQWCCRGNTERREETFSIITLIRIKIITSLQNGCAIYVRQWSQPIGGKNNSSNIIRYFFDTVNFLLRCFVASFPLARIINSVLSLDMQSPQLHLSNPIYFESMRDCCKLVSIAQIILNRVSKHERIPLIASINPRLGC